MCGSIRADALITDRCIGPGSRVDIVLCEVQHSLARLLRVPLPLATGR